jgi:hypothetical protein
MVFQLGRREKQALLELLGHYPTVPPGHYAISKSGDPPDPEHTQPLLDEALAEHRHANKRRLDSLLADPSRLREEHDAWLLTIPQPDLEWLLQVLNDIRIGSWIILGSPDEHEDVLKIKDAPHIWAMEMAGYFQMHLLKNLEQASGL